MVDVSVYGYVMPLAVVAGLRVDKVTTENAQVSLPYRWRNQNPFRSIYFAALPWLK